MMDVGRHPNIELLAYSEVEEITGYVGNFKARIRSKARYVDEAACTACGDCVPVCPVVVPDEYQMGLSSRRAVYIPFPQAVPSAYVVSAEECLGLNPIACGKCIDACEKQCINFDQEDELMEIRAGAIIVATGMEVYDPTVLDEYGYTRFANVVTSLELERLISAGGPLKDRFGRPSDLTRPRRIGFIQCVGSRTQDPERGNPYCSTFCCMPARSWPTASIVSLSSSPMASSSISPASASPLSSSASVPTMASSRARSRPSSCARSGSFQISGFSSSRFTSSSRSFFPA